MGNTGEDKTRGVDVKTVRGERRVDVERGDKEDYGRERRRPMDKDIGSSEVVSPRIDRKGEIDHWPDGFFDETEKSLAKLLMPVED